MPVRHRREFRVWFGLAVTLFAGFLAILAPRAQAGVITNLHQLTLAVASSNQVILDVDLTVTVCSASRPKVAVLIVQDESAVELLQLDHLDREYRPGDRIRIQRNSCFLRKREMGVELSPAPVAANDGLHSRTPGFGEMTLPAGKIPIQMEWFNFWRVFGLDVLWAATNQPFGTFDTTNLWHAVVDENGITHFAPGLRAESYEGSWERIPDFNLLIPAKTGVVTNFDLRFRSRDEHVGIRYSGYLDVPKAGQYRFAIWSDDGSLLFIGEPDAPVTRLGRIDAPIPKPSTLLEPDFGDLDQGRWTTVDGRVSFVTRLGEGVKFDLRADQRVISVRLADATGLDISALLNSRVRLTGIARGGLTLNGTRAFAKLCVANAADLVFLERAMDHGEPTLPIASVAQVQSLPIELARKALPIRVRGTVTGGRHSTQEHWMSFQDDTRGIFVRLSGVTNPVPAFGELWEVEGVSGAGDFAPIIVANRITRLGEGLLPLPIKPTWAELLNGSRDVQWAELTGLVTEINSNTISLHLPEGRLEVEMDGLFESDLRPYLKAVVKIRGVLYAVWDAFSHEVRVGRVMMRNSDISIEVPAPADPFDAVLRTPRELRLFDAQASAFRPVKVRGQIVYVDPTQLFLQSDGTGLRLLPVGKVSKILPGDLVEAVGYPNIGKSELMLREVLLRRTGVAPLPPPKELDESGSAQETLNSTRVRADGKLLGWHAEDNGEVLEMQSGNLLYLARIASRKSASLPFRAGSRLALEGVYVGRGHGQSLGAETESFELLLNSLGDITVLSQPPWWTLPRLIAVVGVLLVVLIVTIIWNTQLRRLVEQRTTQLQREIRERERVEHQHALESERSRIARDLHDDLGSSLTEISVLASTGQLPQSVPAGHTNLFQAISNRARGLISALDVIVWAVDPEDNSLQSLADYLTGYANDFFAHTKIACRFRVPISFPQITLEGRVRHDILMAVKEALNNVVRHSEATEIEFRMAVVGGHLEIDIADNGKGIEKQAFGTGHGLKNLSARLEILAGRCMIEPRPGGGTIVQIRLPLAPAGEPKPAPSEV